MCAELRFVTTLISLVTAGTLFAEPLDSAAAAGMIDRHLAAGWQKAKIAPAAPADDAEFLRRVYLDLAGHIPRESEARQFLDDKRPDKRRRLIEELLYGRMLEDGRRALPAGYVNHFTNVWRALLLPETNASLQARFQLPSFQSWLREHFAKNSGYDTMVRELITTPLDVPQGRMAIGNTTPSPAAFFFAKDLMPENLAAAASRVFLGVKLECAQCHNHPFAKWNRDEFWSFAAFFAGIRRQGRGDFAVPDRVDNRVNEIAIPNTERRAKARFLDGKEPQWKDGVSVRDTLAEWITRAENPYFAKATVNRMWSYFFGRGLVEPVDEMVGGDATTHFAQLLEDLSEAFVDAKYDLKFLVRSIVLSRAYQLSSRGGEASQEEVEFFARMPLRGLTPEQLFDSIALATGFRSTRPNLPPGIIAGAGTPRDEFLAKFNTTADKPTDHQTSILQALALMNGRFVADATSVERSELLAGVIDAPYLDTTAKIEALYLATLSRRPTEKELHRMVQYMHERVKGAPGDPVRRQEYPLALADVFWALLNSAEFMLNH